MRHLELAHLVEDFGKAVGETVEIDVAMRIDEHGGSVKARSGRTRRRVLVQAPPKNHEIAFDAIKHRDAWQRAPRLEAEALEEAQARHVMAEDKTQDGIDTQRRCRLERRANSD